MVLTAARGHTADAGAGEGARLAGVWGKRVPGRGDSECQGPEAGPGLRAVLSTWVLSVSLTFCLLCK